MKLSVICASLCIANAYAFAPSPMNTRQNISLNLFGGKKEGGENKGPGMMDQLAMFKKAQELATKKKKLDEELAQMDIVGEAAEGNIKINVKYLPAQMPMSPTPGYDVAGVDIDEAYLNDVSSEDLSKALVDAIRDGETKASEAVADKYKALQEDLGGIMGGLGGGAPAAE